MDGGDYKCDQRWGRPGQQQEWRLPYQSDAGGYDFTGASVLFFEIPLISSSCLTRLPDVLYKSKRSCRAQGIPIDLLDI